MTRLCALALATLILAGCGVQRPLMKPKDIPAFEEQQRQKREKMEQEQQDDLDRAAARAAAKDAP